MKKIKWNSKAREFVRGLDNQVKREIGALILLIQKGNILAPPQSKPFKTIHKNAFELRIKDQKGAYRVFYVLISKDYILIPHAFQKKTQKTPQKEINLAKKRLKEFENEN